MKVILCSLFIAFSVLGFAQSENELPEDLKAIPAHFEAVMKMNDVSSVKQMNTIATMYLQYLRINKDTAQLITRRMVKITSDSPNDTIKAIALNTLGNSLSSSKDFDEAIQSIEQAKSIFTELGSDRMIGSTLHGLGKIAAKKGQHDDAINYYLNSLASFEKLKDSTEIFKLYYDITGLYYTLSLMDKAEEYTSKAAEIAETMNNDNMTRSVYSARSNILNKRNKVYYDKSKSDTIQPSIYKDSFLLYANRSLENNKLELEIAEKYNHKQSIIQTLIGMIGTYNNIEDYDKAIHLGKRATKLVSELGSSKLESQLNNFLAVSYLETEDYKKALVCGKKSLESAEELGRERTIANSHDYLSRVYIGLGQYREGLKHLRFYDKYLIKTNNLEKVQLVADAESKYESVKQEKQILEQRNDILELESSNAKFTQQRNGFIGGSFLLGILGFIGYNFFKIRRERNNKIAFAEALIFAQETERKRIARDLHDGVGQSLLLIKKQLASNHETTSENNQLISDTLDEVRSISRDLHPFQLEKFGLTIAINDVIEKVEKSTNLFITTEIDNINGMLSAKEEIHFYRVIQESLNNIVKHADATAAKISIQTNENGITAKVMDNGKGYDHEIAIVTTKSLGLRTMYERISSLGGKLKIEKNEPSGTIVNFTIPKKLI
ncbi:MAG: signal transduction histidine kinase [Maribacter sp.]|jgi:signal transduction histidine kinase